MKVLKVFLAVCLIMSFSTCFAVGGLVEVNESGEIVTDSSTDPVYINDYNDYENLLDDTQGTVEEDSGDDEYNAQLKAYYEEYRNYLKDYYDSYERPEVNKAKVTEAGKIKDEYQLDYQTYSVSKYSVQKIKAEILDGSHSGEVIDLNYILTADSMNNIVLAELKKGDTIFVTLTENEDGTVTGDISNSWSIVERVNILFVLGIILTLLLLLYGSKKGFSTSLVVAMTIIFSVTIVPNYAFEGRGVIGVGIFEILALIATITMIHLGLNLKAIKACFISTCLTAVSLGVMVFVNHITRTVGTTFEFAAIAENVILGNINFEHLYYIISLVIAAAFIANTVCMAVKKIERESAPNYDERMTIIKDVLPSNIIPLFVTALTLYIPNHILLLTNKFDTTEIINSETLIAEFARLIAIALCMIVALPIVSLDVFGFGKKYLQEAPEDVIKK